MHGFTTFLKSKHFKSVAYMCIMAHSVVLGQPYSKSVFPQIYNLTT